MSEDPTSEGGKGALLKVPTTMIIYRAAVNNGYNLSPEQRRSVVREAACILEDSQSTKRERVAAAKVLLAADKLDLEAEKLGRPAAQVTNNTQINVGADLSKLTVEQLRALAGNDASPDQA